MIGSFYQKTGICPFSVYYYYYYNYYNNYYYYDNSFYFLPAFLLPFYFYYPLPNKKLTFTILKEKHRTLTSMIYHKPLKIFTHR